MLRSYFIVLMSLVMGLNALAQSYSGGAGTTTNPYQIANKTDLKYLSENSSEWSKHFEQTADITFVAADYEPGGDFYNSGFLFRPFGEDNTNPFTGSYNGNNFTIDNLQIDRPALNFIGLFGVGLNTTISNVIITNAEISGQDYVGGLVGLTSGDGVVNNCTVNGIITGRQEVGGLIGRIQDGTTLTNTVSNCSASGTVYGKILKAGGLVGYTFENTYIQNCNTSNNVESFPGSYVVESGGLVGGNEGDINNSYATGDISGNNAVGGLIGNNRSTGLITNSYSISNVFSPDLTGGLIGLNYGMVISCHATGNISGANGLGGLIGNNPGEVNSCYATGHVFGIDNNGGLIGSNAGIIENSFATGNVNSSGIHAGGLLGFNSGSVSSSYANGQVSSTNYVGGLVGRNFQNSGQSTAIISNCYAAGNASGSDNVAGLVGYNQGNAAIVNCYAIGELQSTGSIGGLVANNSGVVNDSFWDLESTGQSTSAAGVGKTTSEMKTLSIYTNAGWDFVNETTNGTNDYWKLPCASYPALTYQTGVAEDAFAGSGTSGDPFQITSKEDLHKLTQFTCLWNKHYIQTVDIVLEASDFQAGGLFHNGGLGFSRIGNNSTRFTGSYNGNRHTIDGLYINRTGNYMGMFGYTLNATIRDLGLTNVNISGGRWTGGLTGYNDGTIRRCFVTGSVSTSQFEVGGLAGTNSKIIEDSYSTANVSGGNTSKGGLVGSRYSGSSISNCYATGFVSGNGSSIGGLVGLNTGGSVSNSFYDNETTGQDSSQGGTGLSTLAMQTEITFTDAGWDFINETANGTNDYWQIACADYPKLSWQTNTNPFNGSGTSGDPYVIATKNDLKILSENACLWDKDFIQTADITFVSSDFNTNGAFYNGGEGFIPIGTSETRFTGSYNGDGFSINGLFIDRTATNDIGLFGIMNGATAQNISLNNATISGKTNVGGIIGNNLGTVSNVSVINSTIDGTQSIGGVAGNNQNIGSITNSYAIATVSNTNIRVGGLVGFNNGSINSCFANCSVTGSDNAAGGLVGFNSDSGIINDSYALGTVSGSNRVAGFAGTSNGNITNSYAIASVIGATNTGGFIGEINGPGVYTNCYWDTETSGQSTSAAGEGKTTSEMQTQSTYNSWDFVTTWQISCVNYPELQWQTTSELPAPFNGSGTSGDPYVIASKDDLRKLSENACLWDKDFIQTVDIMFFSTDFEVGGLFYDDGKGFKQIGNNTTKFSGSYDGNRHIIDSIYMNRTGSNIGMFGRIQNATISALGLTNVDISGANTVGGIVGLNKGRIQHCFVSGLVSTSGSQLGGLVGINDFDGIITNSFSKAIVSGAFFNIGGLVGISQSGSGIFYSYAIGQVDGNNSTIGGLVGNNNGGSTFYSFYNTETTGQSTSAAGVGKTTVEMQTQSTFTNAGWDFINESTNGTNDVWKMDFGCSYNGYPILNWQYSEPLPLAPMASAQSFCDDGTAKVSGLSPAPSSTIKWYQSLEDEFPLDASEDLGTGTYYVSETSLDGCESEKTAVTITVSNPSTPTVTTPVTYNQGDTASPLTATSGGTGLLWYTSLTGGTGDVNAPTPDTSVPGSTSYWVSSTDSNSCESSREEIEVVVNESTLSIDDANALLHLKVYPNPSSSVFNVVNDYNETFTFLVNDNTGRVVLQKISNTSVTQIDLRNFQNGLYFLKVNSDGKEIIKKIIKK